MKFSIIYTLLLILAPCYFVLGIEIPAGTINGDTWTPEQSPYLITGDIKIEDLVIEPGVEIYFTNDYKFEVEGSLRAEGFYSDSIIFKAATGNTNSWPGIKFKNTVTASSLMYCRIEGAYGQGIFIDQRTPLISNCRIIYNDGNGIRLKETSIEIKHCVISYNTLNGVYLDASQISAFNSIISDNTQAGFLSINNNDVITAVNTVIADNQSTGIDCEKGALTLKNSIVYNNATQIFWNEQSPDVSYSNIEGATVYPGTGNINLPPAFQDRTFYMLSDQSPCIDAGDPSAIYEDGYFPPSHRGNRNDMGAYGGPQANGWYPPLYVEPQNILFGSVTQDSSKSESIKIFNYRNTGITAAEISFQGNNSEVWRADRDNFYLAVLDSTELEITFTPNDEIVFQSDLILQTVAHGKSRASLQGEAIVADIDVQQSAIDFSQVSLGDSSVLNLVILNTGSDTLHLSLSLGTNSVFFLSDVSLKINPDFSSDTIQVKFVPDSAQVYNDSLIILSNDPDERRISIFLVGEGIGPLLNINRDMLEFGSVAVFSNSVLNLTINNLGNDSLFLRDLIITGQHPDSIVYEIADTTLQLPYPLESGSSVILPVRFSPIRSGLATAQLVIKSNDPFREEVALQLLGMGISPIIVLSDTVLNFGLVALSSESQRHITITNLGTDTLVIQDLSIIGQDSDSIVYELVSPTPQLPFAIEPDSSTVIPIRFRPLNLGLVTALLVIQSNDPLRENLNVVLNGTGVAPSLVLSANELDFGEVPLDTQVVLNLTISNDGAHDLKIDSMSIVGQDADSIVFNIVDTTLVMPIKIEPDSSVIVPIRFKPISLGTATARFKIVSTDPFLEETSVALRGTGITAVLVLLTNELDFGQVVLTSDSMQTFYIYNKGQAGLLIPHDSLSISGSHAEAFSIENPTQDITIVQDDSAAVSVRFHPDQIGNNLADLRIVSNDPSKSETIVQLIGVGYDTNKVSITFDPLLSSEPFTKGQAAAIGFEITGMQPVDSAFIYIRSGGASSYNKIPLLKLNGEDWIAQIDASAVNERGIEYYVHAHHGQISTLYPSRGAAHPLAIQVAVPQIQFPWQTKKEIYQMISIPLATSSQTLNDLFSDELGPYDNTQYRIYELTDGVHYTELVNMNRTLPPGKSIWLITKEATGLAITNAQSVITDRDFELQLKQGWNLIATPFAFTVDWNLISTEFALRYYDGTDWPFVSLLEPFKGYAVNVARDTILIIPPRAKAVAKRIASSEYTISTQYWRIQIMAKTEKQQDEFNYVGILEKATSGIDHYDHPEPPPIGDFVSLSLLNDDTLKYSTDYRQPGSDHYNFEFEVLSNIAGPKLINFREENLPDDYDWIVVSEKTGLYYPRKNIQMTEKQARYRLIVGTIDYIAEMKKNYRALPLKFKLAQNYPNPFNAVTVINYQLADESHVQLNIYNILGQHVANLISERQPPGHYKVEWDGRNIKGEQVASGIYILQLKTEKYKQAIKMILKR